MEREAAVGKRWVVRLHIVVRSGDRVKRSQSHQFLINTSIMGVNRRVMLTGNVHGAKLLQYASASTSAWTEVSWLSSATFSPSIYTYPDLVYSTKVVKIVIGMNDLVLPIFTD